MKCSAPITSSFLAHTQTLKELSKDIVVFTGLTQHSLSNWEASAQFQRRITKGCRVVLTFELPVLIVASELRSKAAVPSEADSSVSGTHNLVQISL